jgi:hypothetical protein
MCDPTGGLLTASLVTTALGAASTAYGQQQQQKAYQNVQNAQAKAQYEANNHALALQQQERQRQQALQSQSNSALAQSQQFNSANNQKAAEAQTQTALANQYAGGSNATDYSQIPGMSSPANTNAPTAVTDSIKNVFGNVGNYLRQQAGAKAGMDAFGNAQQAASIYNARQLQNQAVLGQFMQGSSGILGNELNNNGENFQLNYARANNAGNNAAMQAALFNNLGGLGMSVGAQGIMGGLTAPKTAAPTSVGASTGYSPGFSSYGNVNDFLGLDSMGRTKPLSWQTAYPSTGLGPIK